MNENHGATLVELMVGLAITAIMVLAFSTLIAVLNHETIQGQNLATAQETVRAALDKAERALVVANQITIASSTFVQFTDDIWESPNYNPNATTCHGISSYLDADRDCDAFALVSSTAQWQVGYNLKDDDEDGDGKIDVQKRLYLSNGNLLLDTSINEDAWGQRVETLMTHVSTFSLSYFGNPTNDLGKGIDIDGDGIVNAYDIDAAVPPIGQGNNDGVLDTPGEMSYITQIHIILGSDPDNQGKTVYQTESDVYPPLMPIKTESP